jgi:histidine triad (HIT) family protein
VEAIMSCLFCNIVKGNIPAAVVFEDDEIMAFHDVNPQAPTHVLVIPKKHISNINDAEVDDAHTLGRLILTAKQLAAAEGEQDAGYRLIFNVNGNGGQTVHHIHLHLLAGRKMTWPPG